MQRQFFKYDQMRYKMSYTSHPINVGEDIFGFPDLHIVQFLASLPLAILTRATGGMEG